MIPRCDLTPGYSISRLVHGGWQFSSGHRLAGAALDDALEVLVASADLGVTTFDCADIYVGVEELFGRFLTRWRSTSAAAPIQIHTKFVPDRSDLARIDRPYVERVIDRSLTRLGVERLDLVQYYWWNDAVPGMEQTALWLNDLQRAGKIRQIGVTNLDAERVRRIVDAGVPVVSNQVQYSLLDRRPERRLADVCQKTDMRLLAFGALAGGFLTERWVGVPEPSGHANRSLVKYRLIIDEYGGWDAFQTLLTTLHEIGSRHGADAAAVALRHVLDRPAVAAVICGATRPGQMATNVRAFSFELSADDRERIGEHLVEHSGPGGDVFELESDIDGPHGRIMKYDLNRA